MRLRPPSLVLLVLALGTVALVGGGALDRARPAAAAVEHGNGYAAVVDGFRSWYGSYRLGDQGEVWCVDHGIPAPDAVLEYAPTTLEDRAADTRRALAWAVGRHGPGADRVTAAALLLALHDLMGAVYPSGPLSVEHLTADDLSGFEGHEAAVIETARRIKGDAVARAELVGPMVLTAAADEAVAGRTGELRAMVTDAGGAPVEGVVVRPAVTGAELLDQVHVPTGPDGRATWAFTAGAGANRFELSARVPGAELLALRPTRGAAQRVVRPAEAALSAVVSFEGVVPRQVTVRKRGDAEPYLPVAGARFTIDGREVTVGPDGRTPPVEVLPGTYVVTEVEAAPGYAAGGPWTVTVEDADVVLEVANAAIPGELVIEKVDRTSAALTGASFAVRADRDDDPATFEAEIPDRSVPLRPGRYEVREVAPPPHHRLDPVPRVVEVRPGEPTVLRWENVGLTTVGFEKRPPMAGAVFAVRTRPRPDGIEVGRCTTAADGRCTLPDDVVEAGATVCWEEVVAPPGWGLAEGGCLAAGAAGSRTTVTVDEPPLPSPPAPEPQPQPQPEPEVEVAARPTEPPPAPPTPAPVPAVVAELPRTGAPLLRWAGLGLALAGVGLLLVAASRRFGGV